MALGWVCTKVVVVTPPSSELLDTAQAVQYLRAGSSEQALISLFVAACRSDLERRLGRSLSQQTLLATYQMQLNERSLLSTEEQRFIALYLPPVQSVSLLEGQTDPDTWTVFPGPAVTVPPTAIWHVEDNSVLVDDLTMLKAEDYIITLRVTYTVGPTALDPADAMMLLQYVAHRYLNREDDSIPEDLQMAIARNKLWQL